MSRDLVAIARCRRTEDSDPGDLYPDLDAAPLHEALSAMGVVTEFVAWDDLTIDWERFSRVVVSSTWDSVDRPTEYLAWAQGVAHQSILVNDFPFIEWNIDKRHQRDLEKAGVPVIPTVWVAPGDPWEPPENAEFVVKPSISAGGRRTVRYAPGDQRAYDHVHGIHDSCQTVMVQEYLASIDVEGEVDLIFFDGLFSHAVKKKPALTVGEGIIERPWERMAWEGQVVPDERQLKLGYSTLAVVRERIGRSPVYGRVDLVPSSKGEPLVLEVELIDPYLSLDMVPSGATRLATAVLGSEARPFTDGVI